jgi:DNA-binding CsgD family transcriptional regulator/tetratricopeptide (TPR) repeat protein
MKPRHVSAAFIGRVTELERLQRAWDVALKGQPQLVLVAGEAGIGKTRLAKEFAARVDAQDARVLLGECLDLREGGLPYGPIRQALRDLQRTTNGPELAPTRAAAGDVLAALLPELDQGSAADTTTHARVRLFESLLELFQHLADHQPLLLIIDDVHWADHATLDLLTFLARNLSAAPVLELLTFRDDEVGPDVPLLGFLHGRGSGTVSDHIELARFDADEVAAQIAEFVEDEPAPSLIREIFERSDGNPLFVEELIAHPDGATSDIPRGLDALLTRRLAGIDPRAQHVLRVASVAGHAVSYDVLRAVFGLREDELRAGLRAAIDDRLLRVDPVNDSYFFRHALLQEAIRDRLLPSERNALHGAYAETLTRLHGDEPALAGAIASHWDLAGQPERALAAYVDAAAIAERSSAYADAERYLGRASELWDQVDDHSAVAPLDKIELLSRAVDAAVYMEEPARGVPFARAALRELQGRDDQSRHARMQAQLARSLWYAGAVEEGLTAGREAVAMVTDVATPGGAFAQAKHASQLAVVGRLAEARELAAAAIRMAEATGAWRTQLSAGITYASLVGRLESVDEGLRLFDAAAQEARRRGIANDIMRSYLYRGRVLRAAARWDEARECYAEGMVEAPKYGMDRRYVWRFQFLAARVLFFQGYWSDAAALIAQAREHGSRAVLPELAIAVGDFDTAERFLAHERSNWRSDGSGRLQQPDLPVELAIWRGALLDARSLYEGASRTIDASGEPLPLARLCVAGLRAEADIASSSDGDGSTGSECRRRGEELMERLHRLAGLHPVREDGYGLELHALHATGAAEWSHLQQEVDPVPWLTVVEAWERIEMPYPAAYAHLRVGEVLLMHGTRDQAATHLTIADALAAQLGAGPLRLMVAAAAQRGRITLEDGPSDAPTTFTQWAVRHGMTAREQQVLRLVVRGCSNREIGEQLYIAESTASVHVSRILRKLNARTRAEVISSVLTSGLLSEA